MSTTRGTRSGWALWMLGATVIAAASANCTLLLGTFQGTGGEGGAGPAGSAGTNMGSTGSQGGTTSSSASGTGTGGTGGMGGCTTTADCPTPPNVCVTATCTTGVCGTVNMAMGTQLMVDAPGDCHDSSCDGNGKFTMVVDVSNLPPSTNPCLVGTCDATGKTGTSPLTSGMTCTSAAGGKLCDGAGQCVACLKSIDCATGSSCSTAHTCVPASCSNNIQDNLETDTDCGGGGVAPCMPCGDGKMCLAGTDCVDQVCTGGLCAQSTCGDGHQNGNETDVDCGGGTCGACGPNKNCKIPSDCVGTQCGGGTCTPDCKDGVQNNTETDTDCGGSCTACATTKKCKIDSDCISNACDGLSLICVANQCADHRLDGSETDQDCGGSCFACADGKVCVLDTDCISDACDAQSLTCVPTQCSDHRLDGSETDVDCGGSCATKCVTGKKCKGDGDCASNACDGLSLTCVPNQCADHQKDGAETDTDCGGGTCAACATGKGCLANGDCTTAACDNVSGLCATGLCFDQKKDASETDVDCGGGTCGPCANGLKCAIDTDCTSNACDALSLTCVGNQCSDHRRDGSETDIDCGGGICMKCVSGQGCLLDGDCTTNACDGLSKTCVNNQCLDHQQDGVETDVDCGGSDACARCLVGQKCNINSDCQGGHTCNVGTPHLCM